MTPQTTPPSQSCSLQPAFAQHPLPKLTLLLHGILTPELSSCKPPGFPEPAPQSSLSAGLTPRNHADLTLPGKKGALSPRGPLFLAGSPVFTACFPFTLWYAPQNSFSSWEAACLVCAWRLHEPEETQVSATQVPSCCCCEWQAEHQEKGLADMVWRVWSPPKHTLPSVSAVRSDSCKHSCLRTGVHFTQLCIRVGCESYCPN